MGRWRAAAGALAGAVLTIAASAMALGAQARADTLEDWRKIADRVVARYEGSTDVSAAYDAVTPDFDCQGLSLGAKQWPFRNGSIRKIFTRLGEETLARSVAATMPRYGARFLRAARASLQGRHAKARRLTLKLQHTRSGCGGLQGGSLKPEAAEELRDWLRHPAVRRAQIDEERRISRRAIRVSACWARRIRDVETPSFSEYLFFYDYLIQNGGAWVEDLLLIDAFAQVDYRQYGKTDADLVAEKLDLIVQFYQTEWRVAIARGHVRDAQANALALREAQAAGRVGVSETGLLLLKLFRGALGNTPYALSSMNRGVVSLFGEGRVNGTRFDIRAERAEAGPLDPDHLPKDLTCRR